MTHEDALASAFGIANALTAIPRYDEVDAGDLRNALWGIANLIDVAQVNIAESFRADVEESARALVEERDAAKVATRNAAQRSGRK